MVEQRTKNIATIISAATGLVLVFFNLPVAVARWSPIFNSISPTILNWIQNIFIAGFAFLTGWLLKTKLTTPEPTLGIETDEEGVLVEDETPTIDNIVGCVEVGDVAWRGLAEFSDVKVESVEVSRTPRCPQCQKEMTRESYELPTSRGGNPYKSPLRGQSTVTRKLWECPDDDCGHSTKREAGQHSEAQRLFKGYVQDIVESEGQEYSLENLIERVDGEVTPQNLWEAYAEVAESSHVSTNCFR